MTQHNVPWKGDTCWGVFAPFLIRHNRTCSDVFHFHLDKNHFYMWVKEKRISLRSVRKGKLTGKLYFYKTDLSVEGFMLFIQHDFFILL